MSKGAFDLLHLSLFDLLYCMFIPQWRCYPRPGEGIEHLASFFLFLPCNHKFHRSCPPSYSYFFSFNKIYRKSWGRPIPDALKNQKLSKSYWENSGLMSIGIQVIKLTLKKRKNKNIPQGLSIVTFFIYMGILQKFYQSSIHIWIG